MNMAWDAEKIRSLRLRMGWSQSDLARHLHVQCQQVTDWEMELAEPETETTQALDMIFKEAEVTADFVSCGSLAEIMFDESEAPQIDATSIRSKFSNNQ
ncbi:MAG: hypothetical protein COT73_10255 [Bdellovibrio sp. CG10_big_fil_rev_8_21_14_0_10_47_8]|nr:MAG: hypothetical protein COT73_10255 [Bdellovibrio sp. CG10_big_fil_rev_8_21_14_0_10_47_8]